MKLLLSRSTVEGRPDLMIDFLGAISDDIHFLRANYPRFDEWLLSKVIPGIYRGERTVLVEQRDSIVAGLLIVKHTDLERKLCTLRVRPDFESKGLGVRLFETAFDLLGTERPLLSVSESSMVKFARLFAHFGFAQEAVYEGRYLPRIQEFAYNGLLDVPGQCVRVPEAFSTCERELAERLRQRVTGHGFSRQVDVRPSHSKGYSRGEHMSPNQTSATDRILSVA